VGAGGVGGGDERPVVAPGAGGRSIKSGGGAVSSLGGGFDLSWGEGFRPRGGRRSRLSIDEPGNCVTWGSVLCTRGAGSIIGTAADGRGSGGGVRIGSSRCCCVGESPG
jgi:hypothetical protein